MPDTDTTPDPTRPPQDPAIAAYLATRKDESPSAMPATAPPLQSTAPTIDLPPDPSADLEAKRAGITADTEQNIRGLRRAQFDIINQPTPRPPLPRYQNIPPPPQGRYANVFAGESMAGLIFTTALGSLFSRQHGMGAMQAAGSYMEGFRKGDEEKMALARQNWQDQVTGVVKQNQVEADRYDAIWKNTAMSQADKMAKAQAVAAAVGDETTIAALKNGDIALAQKFYTDRVNTAMKLHEIQAKYPFGLGGPSSDTVAEQVQMYLRTGDNKFAPTSNPRTPQAKAISDAWWAEYRRQGGTPEMVTAAKNTIAAQRAEATAGARVAGTREENLDIILRATDAAIPAALEQSAKVSRSGWVPLNRIIQRGQIMASDPELKAFGMANLQLAEHWARAMNPTGVMRESDRDKALSFLDTADSPETYRRAVMQLKTQIERERAAVHEGKSTVAPGTEPDPAALGGGTSGAGAGAIPPPPAGFVVR